MTNGQGPPGESHPGHGFDRSAELAEFAEELRLLAESVLERIEPALRKTALGIGQDDWSSCSWCPVCALVALLRGQRHEVVTALAEHGTAIVTVLREALAGEPVDPRMPGDPDEAAGGAAGASPEAAPDPGPAAGYADIPVTIR